LAREFRTFKSIRTPKALPEGAKVGKEIQPVDRKIMEGAVKKLMRSWNTAGMENMLAEDFFDKSRLFDSIDDKVPRDAKLSILSIQGIQTLSQQIQTDTAGAEIVVSTVSATVKTQLEFNDETDGFQRREGTNEYIFRVKQRKR
jgi:hypothetical protein